MTFDETNNPRLTNKHLRDLGFEKRATMGTLVYIHRGKNIEVSSMSSIMKFDSFAKVWYGTKEVCYVSELNKAIEEEQQRERLYKIKKDSEENEI